MYHAREIHLNHNAGDCYQKNWRLGKRNFQEYEFTVILKSMRVGERGQVTIPKSIRDRFGIAPETDVEFRVVRGEIVLKKTPKKLSLSKWRGKCGQSFSKSGYLSVDEFIEDIRGR